MDCIALVHHEPGNEGIYMTDLFVPVWLALGFIMAIGAMMGMAVSTKNGPMALSPLLAFGPFVAVTLFNDQRSALTIVGLSLLAFYTAWLSMLAIFMVVAYIRHESEIRDITH